MMFSFCRILKQKSLLFLATLLLSSILSFGQWSSTNYHLTFDQSPDDQHVSMNAPSLSGSFTIETWVRLDNNSCPGQQKPTSNDAFVSIGDHKSSAQGAFGGAEIGIQAYGCNTNNYRPVWKGAINNNNNPCNKQKFYFIVGDGAGTSSTDVMMVSSSTTPSCNTWYHVAGVFDDANNTIEMWVNGSKQNTQTYSGSVSFPNTMTMGREAVPTSSQKGYFDGDLDNVAIWNTDKNYSSSSSSSDYYQNTIATNATNLVDYYHFNQSTSHQSSIRDATSSANDGTKTSSGSNHVDFAGSGSSTPLPVELIHFELTPNGESIEIHWSTASELNNHFFTLEKSWDGIHWNVLTKLEGKGTSNDLSHYSFTDLQPYPNQTFYRLKQTDFNGKFEYVAMKSVSSENGDAAQISVSPNPSSNWLKIENVSFPLEQIRFFNAMCNDVSDQINIVQQTNHSLLVDISSLSNGLYSILSPASSAKFIKK
ncbi:MAG: LamG-like jellyroll fold domain-containing protein [Bacteroidota bacterium]|nr:LamG-like jellyroll fold domain-containing protein [Bacteroidota bacterium]